MSDTRQNTDYGYDQSLESEIQDLEETVTTGFRALKVRQIDSALYHRPWQL